MKTHLILRVDAIINLVLGLLLLIVPRQAAQLLRLPPIEQPFYASILGAVLFGIGLALLIETQRSGHRLIGLGLGGAVAINLSGGLVLAGWLIWGRLGIPLRGNIFLWTLVLALLGISLTELLATTNQPGKTDG